MSFEAFFDKFYLRKNLYMIGQNMGKSDVSSLKFLCDFHLPRRHHESIQTAFELFCALEEANKISYENHNLLRDLLQNIHRSHLLEKNQLVKPGCSVVQAEPDRGGQSMNTLELGQLKEFLHTISDDMSNRDVRNLICFVYDQMKNTCSLIDMNTIKSAESVFQELIEAQLIGPGDLRVLVEIFSVIGRNDICQKMRFYDAQCNQLSPSMSSSYPSSWSTSSYPSADPSGRFGSRVSLDHGRGGNPHGQVMTPSNQPMDGTIPGQLKFPQQPIGNNSPGPPQPVGGSLGHHILSPQQPVDGRISGQTNYPRQSIGNPSQSVGGNIGQNALSPQQPVGGSLGQHYVHQGNTVIPMQNINQVLPNVVDSLGMHPQPQQRPNVLYSNHTYQPQPTHQSHVTNAGVSPAASHQPVPYSSPAHVYTPSQMGSYPNPNPNQYFNQPHPSNIHMGGAIVNNSYHHMVPESEVGVNRTPSGPRDQSPMVETNMDISPGIPPPGMVSSGMGVVSTGVGVVSTGAGMISTGAVSTGMGVVSTGVGVVPTGMGVVSAGADNVPMSIRQSDESLVAELLEKERILKETDHVNDQLIKMMEFQREMMLKLMDEGVGSGNHSNNHGNHINRLSTSSVYSMKSSPHGLAVIIGIENFGRNPKRLRLDLGKRRGCELDIINYEHIFTTLKYKPSIHRDLTAAEIKVLINEIASQDHSAYDSLVICFTSHGEENSYVFGSDSVSIDLYDLIRDLQQCPTLQKKPKMFFVQACRAAAGDKPVVISDGGRIQLKNNPEADVFIAWASSRYKEAFRSPVDGSWFVCALKHVFAKQARTTDLVSMMYSVTEKVTAAEGVDTESNEIARQCVDTGSTLRGHVWFFP